MESLGLSSLNSPDFTYNNSHSECDSALLQHYVRYVPVLVPYTFVLVRHDHEKQRKSSDAVSMLCEFPVVTEQADNYLVGT